MFSLSAASSSFELSDTNRLPASSTTSKNGGKEQGRKDTNSALGMIASQRETRGENDMEVALIGRYSFCAVCYTPRLYFSEHSTAAAAIAAHRALSRS